MHVTEVKQHAAPAKQEFLHGEAIPVRFAKNDPDDPAEGWSKWKRYRALALAMAVTYTSAFNATANGAASGGFRADHPGVSAIEFQTSSFAYLVMLGIGPLVLAPVSETFGRRPQIVLCLIVITILFIGQALAPNIACLSVLRFIQGTAASIEGPVAAGVVADLWPKRTRGPAMSIFVLTVFTANGTGPLCANWIAQKTTWHWVYWVQIISHAVVTVLCIFAFPEPRGDVILAKRCKRLTQETGKPHYVEGGEHFEGWGEALKVSCLRPLNYLFTEPIVTALSLYAGFAWGMVFLFVGKSSLFGSTLPSPTLLSILSFLPFPCAIAHVFQETYGFSQGQAGTVLVCGAIGAALSCIVFNLTAERIFQRALIKGHGKAKPEIRLYAPAIGGILFSAGAFAFAWTARSWIHWIVPCIFIVVFNMGIYTIYLATYLYLGDVYDKYSSSAQASQGLLRNVLGAVFPFFGNIMYDKLTFPWASTLVGFLAGAFAIVPWVLIFYGERIRAKSRVAIQMEMQEGEILADEPAPQMTEVEMP
ncbi:hypothetical protein JCM11251_004438 [Rhodosporidiobolus azoricus]